MEKMTETGTEPSADRSTIEDIQSTLVKLKEENVRLRKLMARGFEPKEGQSKEEEEEMEKQVEERGFEDDPVYFKILAEIQNLSQKAENNLIEGVDRARMTGLIAKQVKALEKTKRNQAEMQFNANSAKCEAAELEVARLKKLKQLNDNESKRATAS